MLKGSGQKAAADFDEPIISLINNPVWLSTRYGYSLYFFLFKKNSVSIYLTNKIGNALKDINNIFSAISYGAHKMNSDKILFFLNVQ